MEQATKIAIGVGTSVVVLGGFIFFWRFNGVESPAIPRVTPYVPRMTREEILEFLATHQGNNWNAYNGQSGAREIPITIATKTPLSGYTGRSRESMLAFLSATREAIHGTPYEGCDPRCILWLWCLESGYFRGAWNWNLGNVKAKPYATPESIRQQRAWTTTTHAVNGVYPLRDRAVPPSVDLYFSFDSLRAYVNYEAALFSQTRFSGNVIGGYRTGGLEGCLAARAAQHAGNYAGDIGTPAHAPRGIVWAADVRAYWAAGERLCGAQWSRT